MSTERRVIVTKDDFGHAARLLGLEEHAVEWGFAVVYSRDGLDFVTAEWDRETTADPRLELTLDLGCIIDYREQLADRLPRTDPTLKPAIQRVLDSLDAALRGTHAG